MQVKFFLTGLLVAFGNLGFADDKNTMASSNETLVKLGKVDAESGAESSSINIRFAGEVGWNVVGISDHGTFLQVELPNTLVPNPGQFIEGSGNIVKKMAVFQTTPKTGALRIFVEDNASLVKKSSKVDVLGDRVLITIDHANLTKLVANDPSQTAAPENTASADEVIETTAIQQAVPEPAPLLQSTTVEAAPTYDFQEKLYTVAAFCSLLLIGMLGFLVIAPAFRKGRNTRGAITDYQMRNLASHNLAPKQRIDLIEVGGQKILLGVSPGNISFLTQLETPQQRQTAAAHVQPSAPQTIARTPKKVTQKATSLPAKSTRTHKPPKQHEAINDVTKLIREKLKNIPTV